MSTCIFNCPQTNSNLSYLKKDRIQQIHHYVKTFAVRVAVDSLVVLMTQLVWFYGKFPLSTTFFIVLE